VLKLEAEGKLSIDQTVGHWLPQYTDWANVSIRSLLNMTSDIPNYSEAVLIAETISADMNHQFDYDELIDAVYRHGLPVTTGYFYSNTGNILAAKIIEAASHRSFKAALADMVRPLHLENTFYEEGPIRGRCCDGCRWASTTTMTARSTSRSRAVWIPSGICVLAAI
jgi:D-alanyl-D-alanine carboxypeptidase